MLPQYALKFFLTVHYIIFYSDGITDKQFMYNIHQYIHILLIDSLTLLGNNASEDGGCGVVKILRAPLKT